LLPRGPTGQRIHRLPNTQLATLLWIHLPSVIDVTLRALGPNVRSAVVSHLSTNLYNLANGNLATLVASAFVTEGHHHIYFLLPGLVCLLALGELV